MEEEGATETEQTVDPGTNGQGSLRDFILSVEDQTRDTVTVPEWGDKEVEVRSMTGDERASWIDKTWNEETKRSDFHTLYPELLVQVCYVPGTQEKLFHPEDAQALRAKNAGALERISKAALKLSGLDEEAQKSRSEAATAKS